MNLQKILIGAVFSFVSIFSMQCAANGSGNSTLPAKMPPETEISFNNNAGMVRAGTSIRIARNALEFEELKASEPVPIKWTAQISAADMENLYQVFVANAFDTIKNDPKTGTVYDAGSEGINLSLGEGKNYHVSYGANSPLSGDSLRRYQTIANAIQTLVSQSEDKKKIAQNTKNENYAVLPFEPERDKWRFDDAKPTELNEDEIAVIESELQKAVDNYNAAKSEEQKIELARYKRQFVALIDRNGEKEVWVNCFNDKIDDWREQIVTVMDGGKNFFNLTINLNTKKVSNFAVNGNA